MFLLRPRLILFPSFHSPSEYFGSVDLISQSFVSLVPPGDLVSLQKSCLALMSRESIFLLLNQFLLLPLFLSISAYRSH